MKFPDDTTSWISNNDETRRKLIILQSGAQYLLLVLLYNFFFFNLKDFLDLVLLYVFSLIESMGPIVLVFNSTSRPAGGGDVLSRGLPNVQS